MSTFLGRTLNQNTQCYGDIPAEAVQVLYEQFEELRTVQGQAWQLLDKIEELKARYERRCD